MPIKENIDVYNFKNCDQQSNILKKLNCACTAHNVNSVPQKTFANENFTFPVPTP